jgi:hypothetical protein
MEPDASLNFENGEVIYENNKVGEWVKFWKASFITLFGLSMQEMVHHLSNG